MKTSQARKLPSRARDNTATRRSNGARKGAIERSSSSHKVATARTQGDPLEQERSEAIAELVRLRAELQETPERTGDEVDLSVYDRERTLSLIASYERRLEEIDYAERAAERGAYGICERCGKPIDPARLEIFPETTLCVQCKNQKEKLAKRGIF